MRETILVDIGRGYSVLVYSNTWNRRRFGRFKWKAQVHKGGKYVYAITNIGSKPVYLHREILRAKKGQHVDHINRNTLDCRDDNLRIATPAQNRANTRARKNTSGLKGVTWNISNRKWQATITKEGIRYHLGLFQDKRRAAVAHDRAAKALHGEFAGLNYPDRTTKPLLPLHGFRL